MPMADSLQTLSIAFFGKEAVHKKNAQAQVADLIAAWKRENKGGRINFVIPVEPVTDSLEDLIDYGLTSGYSLCLVGHQSKLENPKVASILAGADVTPYQIAESNSVASGLIGALLSAGFENRLILLADPETDDTAYSVVLKATAMGIKVRSLLHGMDEVYLMPDNEEEGETPVTSDVEEFDDEELEDLEDEPDEDEVDIEESDDAFDDLEALDFDEEDDEPDKNESDEDESDEDESDEDEPAFAWKPSTSAVDAPVTSTEQPEDEESEDNENEGPEMPITATTDRPWTEARLMKMAEKDRKAFLAVAEEHGVLPGRGIKTAMMVSRILEAQNGGPVIQRKTVTAKPKMVNVVTDKPARAKKSAAPEHAEVMAFIDLAQSALDLAKKMLG